MKTTALLAVAGAMTAAAALTAGPASARTSSPPAGDPAVFVQTDNLAGNSVAVYDRDPDGALSPAGVYPTGGLGGQLSGSVADHLSSQGSLAYDPAGHLLYAVNAGSNTITVFSVDGDRLIRQEIISSGGTFPVSIAIHGRLVYVLNARGGGSIQGFVWRGGTLVPVPGWHRDLGFNPDPTPEFVSTPGQIAFTPGGSALVVTTKADGNSIEVFPVGSSGAPSAVPVITPDPGNVPFSVAFAPDGDLAVAEAGSDSLATFSVSPDGTLSLIDRQATGQQATCWVAAADDYLFASNAGSSTVTGFGVSGQGGLSALGNTATDPGTIDAAASPDGRYLYVQTGVDGIVDEFTIQPGGSLTEIGTVTVPGGGGDEGIAVG